MPEAQKATGTTWNTVSDVRTRYDELESAVVGDSAVTRALEDAQNEIKGILRKHWDVSVTAYWSAENIPTYAPEVKAIHLKLTAARCYRESVWGKNSMHGGADIAATFAAQLEEEAWLALDRLIEKGALAVARRTSNADGAAVSWTSGSATDPVFDYGTEDGWPRATSSGDRNIDPYET
jgi:hypothetical protein